jgi:hypothetical protein
VDKWNHNLAKTLSAGCALLLLVCQPVCAATGLKYKGRQAAIDDCSACHRVIRQQKQPARVADPDEARTVETPAFDEIARQYSGRRGALARFIQAPRHPMRELEFPPGELKAIIQYIESLRDERW